MRLRSARDGAPDHLPSRDCAPRRHAKPVSRASDRVLILRQVFAGGWPDGRQAPALNHQRQRCPAAQLAKPFRPV